LSPKKIRHPVVTGEDPALVTEIVRIDEITEERPLMAKEQNIQDILAEVAERAEETRDDATKMYRSKQPPSDPSQVYSIRIPVSRLEGIRSLAAKRGVLPTSMLRSWILERLDHEEQSAQVAEREIRPTAHAVAAEFSSVRVRPGLFVVREAEPSGRALEYRLRERLSQHHRRMAEV
jgi:hypothetical protein